MLAIIIVDMLNDFVTGKLEVDRAKHIIPNLKRLVEAARKSSVPVIYSNDAHFPQDVEVTQKVGKARHKRDEGRGGYSQNSSLTKKTMLWRRGLTAVSTRQA